MVEKDPIGSETAQDPLISVVICTYNRCDLLRRAVQSVCQQVVDPAVYELIVVDNNSTDGTGLVVQSFCKKCSNVHYIKAPVQGLSHARNCGWRNARGKYVLYLDDDATAPARWLMTAVEVIMKIHPAIFGGPYLAEYDARKPKPQWFRDAYGSNTLGHRARAVDNAEYLTGGNIAFKRAILEDLGGFNSGLGMCGKRMAYAEETALIAQVRATMPSELIYYDPDFYIHHLVKQRSMTLRHNIRERFVSGRYYYLAVHSKDPIRRPLWRMLLSFFMFAKHSVFSLTRDKKVYRYTRNYIYERALPELGQAGFFYEQFKASLRNSRRLSRVD